MLARNLLKSVRTARGLKTSASLINVDVDNKGIAVVTMQSPPLNVFNFDTANALQRTLHDLTISKVHGIILTSAFPKIFTSGLDLSLLQNPRYEEYKSWWFELQEIFLVLYGTPTPTVAAISGYSAGFGTLLACSCEYRVMVDTKDEKRVLGYHEVIFGFNPPPWFIFALLNVVPRRVAELASLQGTLFSPKESLSVGLIDELAVNQDEAIEKSKLWLARSAVADLGRAVTKRILRSEAINYIMDNREKDIEETFKLVSSESYQTGLASYLHSIKENKSKMKY